MAISAPPEPQVAAVTRSLAGLADSELVAAVRGGSEPAFEHLYARYHRRVAAYIRRMVGDHGRAEDIAQDVFVSALRRMGATDRPIAFKPWIYEIAKNACIDEHRRTCRANEVSYDAEEGLGPADRGRLVATGPAPDVVADQKLAIDHLRGAFGGLSEVHHEILVMREFDGLSYREIGERLGLSRPAVESTLFRARRRLGEEYEELVSGERCERVQRIIAAACAAAPGARDRRRLAVHLSHCQPCRRHAKVAGLDASALTGRGARAKIAALFPLPAFLRRRWFDQDIAAPLVSNPHVSALAQLSTQLSVSADPALASWARAVVAAGTLAVAGVAGGVAVKNEARPGPSVPVAPVPSAGAAVKAAPPPSVRRAAGTSPVSPAPRAAGRARPRPAAFTSGGPAHRDATPPVGSAASPKSPARDLGPASPAAPASPLLPSPALTLPAMPAAPSVARLPAGVGPGRSPATGSAPSPEIGLPDLPVAAPDAAAATGSTAAAVTDRAAAAKGQVDAAAGAATKDATAAAQAAGSLVGG